MSKHWMRSWLFLSLPTTLFVALCLGSPFSVSLFTGCVVFVVAFPCLWFHLRSVFTSTRFHSVSFAHRVPWTMHKDVLFIIILQELLCISTTWRDCFPFSNPLLNLKKDFQLHLLMNHTPIVVSTLSSHCQYTTIHQLWLPMEEYHQGLL